MLGLIRILRSIFPLSPSIKIKIRIKSKSLQVSKDFFIAKLVPII